ncbi:MAG: oxygen-dependent coproporphyrinogen oxidase [Microscillaceae bacterium]|jgi:coproporphyrinogen III oxidase|nr:oxygen-dependent coproporphyrinogen oxidase [Microscillaceae bacterium]
MNKQVITQYFQNLQTEICQALETADRVGKFASDEWTRPGGGGGNTRIIQNGAIIEKGGVNFSAVFGEMPEVLAKRDGFGEGEFYATGVSIVMHPHSPRVPIIHLNVRYFEMQNARGNRRAWFGGGIDLTPHYVVAEDARFFHTQLKQVCDRHHPDYYPEFKKWADNYFYIQHRQETRGIGGIFFDRLTENQTFSLAQRFAFVQSVGEAFAPIYTALMQKNQDLPFGESEKQWQMLRRGRYVEFNLVYDAGTKFGLETSGRVESILMSLPAQAAWLYNFVPEAHSSEAQTLSYLQKNVDWVGSGA